MVSDHLPLVQIKPVNSLGSSTKNYIDYCVHNNKHKRQSLFPRYAVIGQTIIILKIFFNIGPSTNRYQGKPSRTTTKEASHTTWPIHISKVLSQKVENDQMRGKVHNALYVKWRDREINWMLSFIWGRHYMTISNVCLKFTFCIGNNGKYVKVILKK